MKSKPRFLDVSKERRAPPVGCEDGSGVLRSGLQSFTFLPGGFHMGLLSLILSSQSDQCWNFKTKHSNKLKRGRKETTGFAWIRSVAHSSMKV